MSPHNLFASDPLLQAMFQKDVDQVKQLIRDGAKVEIEKVSGLSPFDLATRNQQRDAREIEIASLVVEHCLALPPELLSLKQAARIAHLKSVRYNCDKVPYSSASEHDYNHAILYAIDEGHLQVVRMLLDAGVNPDACSRDFSDLPMHGEPLLTVAAARGRVEVVKLLIEHNADLNFVYSSPRQTNVTPLMEAVQFNKLAVVKVLVEAGADLRLKDGSGKYALTLAKLYDHKRILAYLETSYAKNGFHNQLNLHEAAREGALGRVESLLKEVTDINQLDIAGETPVMAAVRFSTVAVVQALCDAGADLNAVSSTGDNLWHFALLSNNLEMVQLLLSRGLDPNLVLRNGMSPLIKAAEICTTDIIEELIKAGADVKAVYHQKPPPGLESWIAGSAQMSNKISKQFRAYTAIEFAKHCGSKKAYELLQKYTGSANDAYDDANLVLNKFAAFADQDMVPADTAGAQLTFEKEAKRIGEILQTKPTPWTKRKYVMHFVSSLGTALHSHYPEPSNVRNLFAKNYKSDDIGLFKRLQDEVSAKGYTLVYAELDFQGKALARLLLFPFADPLAVLVACGINAVNLGMDTRDVVNWCAETLRKNPYTIVGAGFDFMDLDFSVPIIDVAKLAERITEFCPEIANDNPDEVALFRQKLDKTGRCFFWWD